MDEVAITAQALAIAVQLGAVISLLQERYLSKLHGRQALAVNVAIAVGIGVVAAARTGLTITAAPEDLFGFAVEVLKVAAVIAGASYATYRYITKPVAARKPARASTR